MNRNPAEPPLRFSARPVPCYSAAVTIVSAAWLLKLGLTHGVGLGLTYVTFFPALMLIGLVCGFGPSLMATCLAGLLAAYFVLPPVGQLAVALRADRIGLAIFLSQGVLMSFMARLYHQANAKVMVQETERAAHLQALVAERTQELEAANRELRSEITERAVAESALRKSEATERARREELEALMDAIPAAVFIAYDPQCRQMSGNPTAQSLLRLAPGQNPSKSAPLSQAPEFAAWAQGRLLTAAELPMQIAAANARAVSDMEFQIVFPDGAAVDLLGGARPLFEDSGAVRGCVGAFVDITQRKQAEAVLRQNAALFSTLIEQAPVGVFVLDEQFRVRQVSTHAMPTFASVHPLIGRDFTEVLETLWGPIVGPQVSLIFRHTLDTGERYVSPRFTEQRHDIGEEQVYEWEIQGLILPDGQHGLVCYFQDVTEPARSERALRASEERTSLATAATGVGIWEWNILSNTLHWDAEMFRIYGLPPTPDGRVPYGTWSEAVLPEDLQEIESDLVSMLRLGGQCRREFCIRRASDNERRYIESVKTIRTNAKGQAECVVGTNLDVTVRTLASEELRRSENLARSQWAEAEAALEAVPANIAVLDADGVIVRVNSGWASFGAENGMALGSGLEGDNYLTVCDTVKGSEGAQAQTFAAGIRRVIGRECERFSMEYPCHSPKEKRWFVGYVTATTGPGPLRAVVAHVDITTQKRSAEQIRLLNSELENRVVERTSELQAAIGALESEMIEGQRLKAEVLRVSEEERLRLAADLHDGICQEMVGIQLLTYVLGLNLKGEGHALSAEARRIEEAIRETTDHTRQVARGMNPVVADGEGLMHALVLLTENTAQSRHMHCSFHCPARVLIKDPRVANELYRIVQEAIYNAIRHGQAKRITVSLRETGHEACLAVRDNGGGLPGEVGAAPGMGLRVMRYRAGGIGGRLVIQPRRRGGTEVICRFASAKANG